MIYSGKDCFLYRSKNIIKEESLNGKL